MQNSGSGFFLQEPTRGSTTRGTTSQTRLLGEVALGLATRFRQFSEWGADLLSECEPTKKPQKILKNAEGVTHQFSRSDTIEKPQKIFENAGVSTHLNSELDTTEKSRAPIPVGDAPTPVLTLLSGVPTRYPTTSLPNEYLRVHLESLPSGQSTRTPLLKRSTGSHSTLDASPL